MMPLAMLRDGEAGRIVAVYGGRGLMRRLAELGFIPGERVKVLRSGPGPILVLVKGSRMALGHGVAMKILVSGDPG